MEPLLDICSTVLKVCLSQPVFEIDDILEILENEGPFRMGHGSHRETNKFRSGWATGPTGNEPSISRISRISSILAISMSFSIFSISVIFSNTHVHILPIHPVTSWSYYPVLVPPCSTVLVNTLHCDTAGTTQYQSYYQYCACAQSPPTVRVHSTSALLELPGSRFRQP